MIQFDWAPVARLEARLTDSTRDVRRQVDMAVRKAALEVERAAKQRAPVDTGFLRNSITTSFTGSVYDTLSADVGPEANYGVFLEFGTWRMSPRPFMGPAAEAVEPSFLAAMSKIDPLGGL